MLSLPPYTYIHVAPVIFVEWGTVGSDHAFTDTSSFEGEAQATATRLMLSGHTIKGSCGGGNEASRLPARSLLEYGEEYLTYV